MSVRGFKKQIALFGIAGWLVALVCVVAVLGSLAGIRLPGVPGEEVLLGSIALAISLPLLGVPLLFVSRPNLRVAWRNGDRASRAGFGVYLAIDLISAAV